MTKSTTSLTQHQLFKDGCELTDSMWVSVITRVEDVWQVRDIYHRHRSHSGKVKQAIIQWMSLEKFDNENLLQNLLDVDEQKEFGCQYLGIVKNSPTSTVLVGSNHSDSARDLRVWNLICGQLDEPTRNYPQLKSLEDTVLELQLTQQELQARIAAQHEAESRLIQAAKLAAVGEMAAGIAHELNNPLTTVIGFTELALEDADVNLAIRKDLEMVLKEARRASSVVRRMLDFARQSETVRMKVDVNEIVADVMMFSRHIMTSANIQLILQLGENLRWVSADRNQINQVVINLVNNAISALPNGGAIQVTTGEQARYGRDWLTLSVGDNGVGISPANLERIFEPFFTTRADSGGTGLGLSVTYGIVSDHGGMIEVESQVNIGSTFVVWLPLEGDR